MARLHQGIERKRGTTTRHFQKESCPIKIWAPKGYYFNPRQGSSGNRGCPLFERTLRNKRDINWERGRWGPGQHANYPINAGAWTARACVSVWVWEYEGVCVGAGMSYKYLIAPDASLLIVRFPVCIFMSFLISGGARPPRPCPVQFLITGPAIPAAFRNRSWIGEYRTRWCRL